MPAGERKLFCFVRGGARRFAARRGDCSPAQESAHSKQEKRGDDLFLAYGYEFTQQEWNETYKKKSKLEQKLGLAGDIEENEPELEPAE